MKWFRFYTEAMNDPKVQEQLTPSLYRDWTKLLCIASESADWGYLPKLSDVAYQLRKGEEATGRIIEQLSKVGLLDKTDRGWSPHNWFKRQYVSDDTTARTRRFRGQHGNVPANENESVSDTETEYRGFVFFV